MQTTKTRAQFVDRETARERLTKKIANQRKNLADPNAFSTVDPHFLIADAEFRLRWIDCAPEGANHQTAPLCDKTGTPMGGVFYESTFDSASKSLREAIERKTGRDWKTFKTERARARQAA